MEKLMKAVVVKEPGGIKQLQIQEIPIPKLGPDEVLVEMKVAGINFIDIYFRKGLYKSPHYPFTPGKEGSGIVAAIGREVKDVKPGDRVAFFVAGSGTYAEYATIPANQVVLIPNAMDFELAAACMLQGSTAYYLSHLTYPIKQNDRVLIHAGAGGVGLLLIQMAKMLGATVITTVSNEQKAKLVKEDGADHIILYTKKPFLEDVMEYTQQKGVNVVYDGVGKTTFDDSLASLDFRGMLASFGQSSGPIPPLEVTRLSEKSLYLTRPVLFHYARTKNELVEITSALFDLIEKGKLKIKIGQRYPLEEVAKAHDDLENRKTVGKSILII